MFNFVLGFILGAAFGILIIALLKAGDEIMNEKMNLEEKIKQALKILKNEDGTLPDYKIIEEAIECLETKGE